jgi:hypothetical protein
MWYTIDGPEFGPDNNGRSVQIIRVLYGLSSSGTRWRDHLADTIRSMGLSACLVDGDVWLWPALKPGGAQYYEYVLVYVDDFMAISLDLQSIMDTLSKHYTLKASTIRAQKHIWDRTFRCSTYSVRNRCLLRHISDVPLPKSINIS